MTLAIAVVLLVFCFLALAYLFQGPIYVPTHSKTVEQMVALAQIRPGTKVADLGSGDGRIAIAMALAGAAVTGFEINPILVWYSRSKIRKAGLADKIRIEAANFWSQNLGEYDVVTIFGIDHVMERLGRKLALELKPGALVISNAFRVPQLSQVKQVGSLILYKRQV